MRQARVGELSGLLAPRELSTLLWAYGKLQAYPGVEIMETLVMRARLSLDKHAPHVRNLPPPSPYPWHNEHQTQAHCIDRFLDYFAPTLSCYCSSSCFLRSEICSTGHANSLQQSCTILLHLCATSRGVLLRSILESASLVIRRCAAARFCCILHCHPGYHAPRPRHCLRLP